jgi:hypothetical protein
VRLESSKDGACFGLRTCEEYRASGKTANLACSYGENLLGFFRSSALPRGKKGEAGRSSDERAAEAEAEGRGATSRHTGQVFGRQIQNSKMKMSAQNRVRHVKQRAEEGRAAIDAAEPGSENGGERGQIVAFKNARSRPS